MADFLQLRRNKVIAGEPVTEAEKVAEVESQRPNKFLQMRQQKAQETAPAELPGIKAPLDRPPVVPTHTEDDAKMFESIGSVSGGLGDPALETARRFAGGVLEIPAGLFQAGLDLVDHTFGVDEGEQPKAGVFADKFNAARDATKVQVRAEFADSMAFDMAETAGEIIPSFFLPFTKTKKAAAAVGGAQGLAQFQDDPAVSSRVVAGLTGAAVGGLAQGVADTINFFRPSSFVKKSIDRNAPQVDEAVDLTRKTGVEFKPSQATEDLGVRDIEQLAKTSIDGEKMAKAFENKQTMDAFKHFKKIERSLDGNKADFGTRITKAFDGATEKVLKQRSKQATTDFDAARKIAGDAGIIPSNNTTAALDDIIAKFKGDKSMAVPEVRAFMRKIENFKAAFDEAPTMNVKDLQTLLESMGRASDGKAGLFSKAPGFDKYSTTTIHKALQQDLAEAAEAGVPGAELLKRARDNYAGNSLVIDELKSTTLASLFKSKTMPPPEKVQELFATMPPSQIRSAMKLLGDVDPGLHQGLQRFTLGSAIGKARVAAADLPSGEVRIDMNVLMKQLANDDQFKAIFADVKTRQNVMDGVRALRKLQIGKGQPGTQLQQKIVSTAGSAVSRSPIFLTRAAAQQFVPAQLSKILFSKGGVANLQALTRKSSSPAVVAAAAVELEEMLKSGSGEDGGR